MVYSGFAQQGIDQSPKAIAIFIPVKPAKLQFALVTLGVLPVIGFEPTVLVFDNAARVTPEGISIDAYIKLVAVGVNKMKRGSAVDSKALGGTGDRVVAADTD